MKILHCCLSCFYIDRYAYQENLLARKHAQDGHTVHILASTETLVDNQSLGYLSPGSYVNEDNIPVTRLPYSRVLPHVLMKKIRKYIGAYKAIEQFKPDVIFFHGACAWDLQTIVKYIQKNPSVKLYIDSHEDYNNSARSFVSKNILHRLLYRPIIRKCAPYAEKVLYVSLEAMDFLKDLYGLPQQCLELFPLGGTMIYPEEKRSFRLNARKTLSISKNDLVFIHIGKLTQRKKTIELLLSFAKVPDLNAKLIIIGSLAEDIAETVKSLITADNRVNYLGWKCANEIPLYLCASDLYLQPGTQSATFQQAMCCGIPVMIYPYRSYKPYMEGNGFYVKDAFDMNQVFVSLRDNREQLKEMSENSYRIAEKFFDYKKLAARIYNTVNDIQSGPPPQPL